MRAAEIHAALAGRWREVLVSIGIGEEFLRDRHGPCPICGGKDRFRFDDRKRRGDFYCNGCGAGDGFALVMRHLRCDFQTARDRVLNAAGLTGDERRPMPVLADPARARIPERAQPTRRIFEVLRTSCEPPEVTDVRRYLASRSLWPLPPDCALRAHASLEYFEARERIGRFGALVAPVCDVDGELVSVHVTYLAQGRKLESHEPRKLLSRLTGRQGCAVRLMPPDDGVLGIGEGLETSLSAHRLSGVPTWAALNATLLARFAPPPGLRKLVVFPDRDVAGMEAAARLIERLQGVLPVEMRLPPTPYGDFNDVLRDRGTGSSP